VEATRRITSAHPEVQVLALTSSCGGDRVRDALGAGAVGYLLKDADPEAVLDGVRRVHRGESPLDPRAVRAMLEQSRHSRQSWLVGGRHLTARQHEVLQCLEEGMTNPQIATALGISAPTVKVHVGGILQYLGVADREAAARWAQGAAASHHVA
jgi:DNA-binding NarL/FixJ family response regulator